MLDRHEYLSDEGSRGETAPSDAENARALQAYVNRETALSLPVPEDGTNYAELFARLQKLIDNATQTIRDLRRENADLSGRISQLDAYIQMRAEVIGNEEELQKSASRLEELLALQGAAQAAVTPPAPPTPLRAFEPTPPAPAPPAPPVASMVIPVEPLRESPATTTNGHAPLHETAPYVPPAASLPPLPPLEPVSPAFSTPAPRPSPEPPYHEAATYAPPTIKEAATREAAPYMPPMTETATKSFPPPTPRAPESTIPIEAEPVAPPSLPPMAPAAFAPASVATIEAPPAPVAAPVRRPAPVPLNGNEKVAGTYALVVYPFTRFSDLGQFQSVLQELVGIHDVQVRRFAQGTLEMRLGYDGVTPLPQALHNLSVGIEDVEEEEPYRLRVRLDLNHGS